MPHQNQNKDQFFFSTNFLATLIGNLCHSSCVETYYCLRQAVGDKLVFEVEVIDPKNNQRDV